MGFNWIQGNVGNSGTTVTSVSVVLATNPVAGNLVCVGLSLGDITPVSSFAVKDSNNNSYTITANSPSINITNVGKVLLAYLLSAPANATKTITASWSVNMNASIWADEFSVTGGSAGFDKDASTASAPSASTAITLPSITPTNGAGELLYACVTGGATLTAPAAAGTAGVWTGAGGGISTTGNGGDAEYDLSSAAGASAVNFTQNSSAAWSAMAMAFTFTSSAQVFDEGEYLPPVGGGWDSIVSVW